VDGELKAAIEKALDEMGVTSEKLEKSKINSLDGRVLK
jgi:ArsR family metal-binding transcriptional regulator